MLCAQHRVHFEAVRNRSSKRQLKLYGEFENLGFMQINEPKVIEAWGSCGQVADSLEEMKCVS